MNVDVATAMICNASSEYGGAIKVICQDSTAAISPPPVLAPSKHVGNSSKDLLG